MKRIMLAVFAVLLLISAGAASAATSESVDYPGGTQVSIGSIVQYAHPENALECAITNNQASLDCSGEVVGYSVTSIHTDSAYQTYDIADYYNSGARYYTHSVYAYKSDCLFGLACYVPVSSEHSTDGINWMPGN